MELKAGGLQQCRHLRLETISNALKRGEGKVLLAALNLAVISPMHLDVVCEAFLANAQGDAACANDVCQGCLMRVLDHASKLVAPVL